jgi:uncharacterized membrane protein HdeD (DUF308 family)
VSTASEKLVAGSVLAVAGVASAIYFLDVDPCKSSARIGALYAAAPVLLGMAGFIFATRFSPRCWLGLTVGVATAVASGVLLILIAFVLLARSGCTIG